MKTNKIKKIVKYCLIAFCTTCVLGGFVLWVHSRWDLGQIVSDVYFPAKQGQKTWADSYDADRSGLADTESAENPGEQTGNANNERRLGNESAGEQQGEDDMPDNLQDAPDAIGNKKEPLGNDVNEEAGEVLPEIPTDQKGEVTLAFGGDICFYDPYANMATYRDRGSDIKNCISSYLLEEMLNADVCMVNNEFSYSNRGTPLEGKMYTFRSKPENVNILHDMGVDIVSVANNHAYDYGQDAFVDTLKTLDDANILCVGGGENLEEASEPVFVTRNNLTIGYVAATQIERNDAPDTKGATKDSPGVLRCFNQTELDHFLDVVKGAKQQCDFLVVYIHWGTENTDIPDWAQPHQAELISQAGADLIVGCHPHCLQGITVMNDVPVIYSLGNYWFNSKTVDTALLKVKVSTDGIDSLQMIAAQQAGCLTKELNGSEKARVLQYLQGLSPKMTIDADGFVTW